MANPWFRFYSEFASDPKVQILSEALQRRYVMLLCLHNADHYIDAKDDELAFALNITVDDWQETKAKLIQRGLLNEDGSIYGWEKRQTISDLKDPGAAERQKKYRERRKENRESNVTRNVTPCNVTPLEEKRIEENRIDKNNSLVILPSPSEDGERELKVNRKKNSEAETALLQCVGEGWNELASAYRLPQVSKLTEKRKSWVVARAKELVADYDYENPIDGFSELFNKIKTSKFLRGEANGFRCDFDFAFNQSSFTKIMEGRYENS
jgi:hypothetical protein